MKLLSNWRYSLAACFVLTGAAFLMPGFVRLFFMPPILIFGVHTLVILRMNQVEKALWRPDQVSLWGQKLGLYFSNEDSLKLARRYGAFFDALSHRDGWETRNALRAFFLDGTSLLEIVRGYGDRKFRNVVHGIYRGRQTYAFDYGELSGAIIPCDYGFRTLVVRRQEFVDKSAAVLGLPGVTFESHEFSRLFHVAAEDPKYAYSVINSRVMELLMAHPGWNIALTGNLAMIYRAPLWTNNDYREALELLSDLVDLIPHFIRGEFSSDRESNSTCRLGSQE